MVDLYSLKSSSSSSVASLLIKTRDEDKTRGESLTQTPLRQSQTQSKRKRDGLYNEIMQRSERHYSPSSSYSIYKVPGTLRRLKPRAYNPCVVSIGLIHAKDQHVQPMNEHKENYMYSLFHRTAKSEETRKNDISKTIDLCVNAMVHEARCASICYPPSVRLHFDVNTIARTMLVDGCFVLELLMRSSIIKKNEKKRELSDPIFRNNLKVRDIVHDLLQLENQIPFFVLEHLFRLTVERIQNRPELPYTSDP